MSKVFSENSPPRADQKIEGRPSVLRSLAQGGTPDIPESPRSALSGLLRGRIEDTAGVALFNLAQSGEAVARLRRAISVLPTGTPL